MTKHRLVASWAMDQDEPWRVSDILTALESDGVSVCKATVSKALQRHLRGRLLFAWEPTGKLTRKFRHVYFPVSWSRSQAQAWLDQQNKKGKSRATIELM